MKNAIWAFAMVFSVFIGALGVAKVEQSKCIRTGIVAGWDTGAIKEMCK